MREAGQASDEHDDQREHDQRERDPDQHLLGGDVEPAVVVVVAVDGRIDVVGHRVTALATAPNAEPAATSATKWLPVPTTTAATATG